MTFEKLIIGAVAGDMVGSHHKEQKAGGLNISLTNKKPEFTANTVLTVATMDALLNGREYTSTMKSYGERYPGRGYGPALLRWMRQDEPKPYHSWNNSVALRVSPVGHACRTVGETVEEAGKCAAISHNHPDGIKGAQAAAVCVFLAKNGRTKEDIRSYIEATFRYDLQKTIEMIRQEFYYDHSCESSVPAAITAFLDSSDYEDALRLAISLGGGCGSLACITGGIAQAFYKDIPRHIAEPVIEQLSPGMFEVIDKFSCTYPMGLFI